MGAPERLTNGGKRVESGLSLASEEVGNSAPLRGKVEEGEPRDDHRPIARKPSVEPLHSKANREERKSEAK